MYNVLIADDEEKVCRGLSIIIEWEKYGFHVLNTAENGMDALEKLKKERYNLIITDIRMPLLNGLELIKTIREQNPGVKVLIISGHSDFSYAKQAIEYGVKGYLLKPIDRGELLEHVLKIKEELDNELKVGEVSIDESLTLEIDWNNKLLMEAVEQVDINTVKCEIEKLFDEIIKKRATRNVVQALMYNVVFGLCAIIKKNNGDVARVFGKEELEDITDKAFRLEKLKSWLIKICSDTADYIIELVGGKSNKIIDQIKKYIDENFYMDLSIKTISNVFYLNPAYIGQLFKNSVGESFNSYLNKKRISEVKRMVALDDSNINYSLEKAGYHNPEYFYKQFKRYEGITFSEYRENIKKYKK